MKNSKVIEIALLTVLAISAIGAAAASADELTAEESPTALTGKTEPGQVDQLLMTWGTVYCPSPTYTATVIKPTTAVAVTPDYSDTGCSIHVNGCTYLFHVQEAASTTGDVDLVCPAGKEMTITPFPNCVVHIGPQSDIGGVVTYSNVGIGNTREITVRAELLGIDYTHTKTTGLGSCGNGSGTNGTFKGNAIVTGENHAGTKHIGLFLS